MTPFTSKRIYLINALVGISLLALFVVELVTSQQHVDGDEAVIGVMAQHILTRGVHPLFFYGQEYGAGGGLEAHLAAVGFAIFGSSGLVLHAVGLSLFVLGLFATWYLCNRHFSAEIALLTILVIGLATPLVEWRTKMRGGYVAILLCAAITLLLYFELLKRPGKWLYLGLGLALGISYLNSALSLSLFAAVGVATLLFARRLIRIQGVLLAALGVVIGLTPLIWYDLTHDFGHWQTLLGLRGEGFSLIEFQKLFIEYLPRFFVSSNVDAYVDSVGMASWIEMGLLLLGIVVALLFSIRDEENRPKLAALGLLILIHLILFTLSRDRTISARYFLPLYPAIAILFSYATYSLWLSKQPLLHWVSPLLLLALIVPGLISNVNQVGTSTINDDILDTNWQVTNVSSNGDVIERLIDVLQANGVSHAKTGYFIQWRMLFEGQGSIVASSENYFPTIRRFVEFDNSVNSAEKVAIILHKESQHFLEFDSSAESQQMRRVDIDAYTVFLP